jgi:hypothetical protein
MSLVSATPTTTAVPFDITIEQGADVLVDVLCESPDGSAFPLSGYTAAMDIRPYTSSDTTLLELKTDDGSILIDGVAGKVTLKFAKTMFDGTWFNGVYDLEIYDPSGSPTRILKGNFYVDPEVTR